MHDPEPEAPKGNAAINLINVTCAFPAGTIQNICYEKISVTFDFTTASSICEISACEFGK